MNGAVPTTFTHSCGLLGVALGLRVLDLFAEVPANTWFCHCSHIPVSVGPAQPYTSICMGCLPLACLLIRSTETSQKVNQLIIIMLQKAPKLQTKEIFLRPEKVEDLQTTDACID